MQNFSNFEPIYVMLYVCSFHIALLFWYVNLCDLLQVWKSQWSRCTGSLDSQTGWWRAFVGTHKFIFMCILFFSSHSLVICFLSWVTLQLLLQSFGVAVCSSLSWGLATWREAVEEDCQSAIYKATRPVYCIASHHKPRPDQLHNTKSSHQRQSPIFGLLQ